MKYLIELGISENDLKNIFEINNNIADLSDEEVIKNIELLRNINCSDSIINNIVISNPVYLLRDTFDLVELVNKLNSIGIKRLDIVFDSNPWLLNKDSYEIDDFIEKKTKEGLSLEDIIDMIDSGIID